MSEQNAKKKFATDTGEFVSEEEAKRLRGNFCSRSKRRWNHDEYTQGYFFGRDRLLALLNCQDDIAGLRIFYGADTDNDGIDDHKMVIYAVDHNGDNVLYRGDDLPTIGAGAGDPPPPPPPGGGTSGGGKALDGGMACPTACGNG